MSRDVVDGYGRTWQMFSKSDPQRLPPGAFNGRWDENGRLVSWCSFSGFKGCMNCGREALSCSCKPVDPSAITWRKPGDPWPPPESDSDPRRPDRDIDADATRYVLTLIAKGIGILALVHSPLIVGKVGGLLGWWQW